jgi:hypothetical protein
LEFTYPKAGDELSTALGVIELLGTVTIPENFGYYKYEYARVDGQAPSGAQAWVTIQARDAKRCPEAACQTETQVPGKTATPVPNDELGTWDLSQLTPGDYLLRLVATDNDGNALPACQIPLRISAPETNPGS